MYKYLQLFTLSWQNGLVYRTSLFMWRLRQLMSTLMALTIWTVLFQTSTSLFGYTDQQMITYIFLAAFLNNVILTTSLHGLSGTIYSGALSFNLLKPVNIYLYLFTEDIADKIKNIVFIIAEMVLLYVFFHPQITLPSLSTGLLFFFWVLGGLLIHFLIQLIFGSLGFWSPETWGPRFLFFMFVDFTAGRLFPLDVFPLTIQRIIFATPFPYFSFMQSQLFLGKISPQEALTNSLMIGGWILILSLIAKKVWQNGLREYAASGQ